MRQNHFELYVHYIESNVFSQKKWQRKRELPLYVHTAPFHANAHNLKGENVITVLTSVCCRLYLWESSDERLVFFKATSWLLLCVRSELLSMSLEQIDGNTPSCAASPLTEVGCYCLWSPTMTTVTIIVIFWNKSVFHTCSNVSRPANALLQSWQRAKTNDVDRSGNMH